MVILEITGFWENGAISFWENGAILFWEISAVFENVQACKIWAIWPAHNWEWRHFHWACPVSGLTGPVTRARGLSVIGAIHRALSGEWALGPNDDGPSASF